MRTFIDQSFNHSNHTNSVTDVVRGDESLVSDARCHMKSREMVERKLQNALRMPRGSNDRTDSMLSN